MKDIKEAFEEMDEGMLFLEGEYDALLESMGFDIILKVDDNNYQGDSNLLFQDKEKIGYLNFGWGSCSGCDALAACDSWGDAEKLRTGLFNDILWKDTKKDMLEYFITKDWELDHVYHMGEFFTFIKSAVLLLGGTDAQAKTILENK